MAFWLSSDVLSDDDRFILAEVRSRFTVIAYFDVVELGDNVTAVDVTGAKRAEETLDTVSYRPSQVHLLGQVLG